MNRIVRSLDSLNPIICSECGEIYGYWNYCNDKTRCYRQLCSYDCSSRDKKVYPRTSLKVQEEWPTSFDIQQLVTLCHCCGKELLKSGSKWSVWFCDYCKGRVREFNVSYGIALIPIGRHSLMNQVVLDKPFNERAVNNFTAGIIGLQNRIGSIHEWRKIIIAQNLKFLGYSCDAPLDDYLSKVKMLPSKEVAFRKMSRFFLPTKHKEGAVVKKATKESKEKKLKPGELNKKGTRLVQQHRYREAITCFDEAIKIKPRYALSWSNKGNALLGIGNNHVALDCFNEAIKINPKITEGCFNKGIALYNLNRYSEALICFDEVIKLDYDFPQVHQFRQKALFLSAPDFNLLPSDTCVFCDKALEDVGGFRIVAEQERGIFLYNNLNSISIAMKNDSWRTVKVFDDLKQFFVIWGEKEKWTERAIGKAKNEFASGKHPWYCQICAGLKSNKHDSLIEKTTGVDVLYEGGSIKCKL